MTSPDLPMRWATDESVDSTPPCCTLRCSLEWAAATKGFAFSKNAIRQESAIDLLGARTSLLEARAV